VFVHVVDALRGAAVPEKEKRYESLLEVVVGVVLGLGLQGQSEGKLIVVGNDAEIGVLLHVKIIVKAILERGGV